MRRRALLFQLCQYLLLRLILGLVMILPDPWAGAIGRACGHAFRLFSSYRRRLAMENLTRAFPAMNDLDRRLLLRSVFGHFWRNLFLSVRSLRFPPDEIKKRVSLPPEASRHVARVRDDSDKGTGSIGVLMHFGNLGLLGRRMALEGLKLNLVLGTTDNRFLDRYLGRLLSRMGIMPIYRKMAGSYRNTGLEVRQLLASGQVICLLSDTNWFSSKPVIVDFFGHPASTTRGPAHLAFDFPVPVYVCHIEQAGKRSFQVHIQPCPIDRSIRQKEDFIQHHMQSITHHIESVIRSEPEQWLWLHPRWRLTDRQRYLRESRIEADRLGQKSSADST